MISRLGSSIAAALTVAALAASSTSARAQQQVEDMCAGPLPYQASAPVDQRFRLQCTVQRLLVERADAENRATAAEVQSAVEAAHARAQSEALDASKAKVGWWEKCAVDEQCLAWLMPRKSAKFDWFGFWKR